MAKSIGIMDISEETYIRSLQSLLAVMVKVPGVRLKGLHSWSYRVQKGQQCELTRTYTIWICGMEMVFNKKIISVYSIYQRASKI